MVVCKTFINEMLYAKLITSVVIGAHHYSTEVLCCWSFSHCFFFPWSSILCRFLLPGLFASSKFMIIMHFCISAVGQPGSTHIHRVRKGCNVGCLSSRITSRGRRPANVNYFSPRSPTNYYHQCDRAITFVHVMFHFAVWAPSVWECPFIADACKHSKEEKEVA